MNVTVVGAGIYGLCTAVQLVAKGHRVEVFDRSLIPNPLASSYDYHRLIRHAYGPQEGYSQLIPPALEAWERLWELLGESFYIETGALAIGPKYDPWIAQSRKTLARLGVETQDWALERAAERLPWLRIGDQEELLFCKSGGILRSGLILEALGQYLRSKDVVLRENTDITSVSNGQITDAEGNKYKADHIVCALGAGHGYLFPGEIRAFRQVYALYDGVSGTASIEQGCPMILDIGDNAGFYYVPGSKQFPAKVGDHISRLEGHPYEPRKIFPYEIESLKGVIQTRIHRSFGSLHEVNGDSKANDTYPTRFGLCFYESREDHIIQLQTSKSGTQIFGGSGHGFKFGALFGETVAEFLAGKRSFQSAQEIVQGKGAPYSTGFESPK